jgi:hypothetical protein
MKYIGYVIGWAFIGVAWSFGALIAARQFYYFFN